jgi:hypothetical protein
MNDGGFYKIFHDFSAKRNKTGCLSQKQPVFDKYFRIRLKIILES